MQFEEKQTNIITVPNYTTSFIYFLLRKDDVVYVGQTRQGISRPFSHRDKEFDKVKLLSCKSENLDKTEDFYIEKYKPIYNKQRNYSIVWGLERVRNSIRKEFLLFDFNIPKLRKVLTKLNIKTKIDNYSQHEYITQQEYTAVMQFLRSKHNYEIHN